MPVSVRNGGTLWEVDMTRLDRETLSRETPPSPGDLALVSAMLRRLKAGADMRSAKVKRIKASIRSQEYENPLKLDIAVERAIDHAHFEES